MTTATTTATSQGSNSKKKNSIAPLVSGFVGGVVSTALLLPLDVVKLRLQVTEQTTATTTRGGTTATRNAIGFWRVARAIVRHEGLVGLYQGLTPAVIGSAVSWGGYFYFYEGFKRSLVAYKVGRGSENDPGVLVQRKHTAASKEIPSNVLNSLDNFVLACAAGGVMVILTNPIWLVKTRMQLQLTKSSEQHNIKPYRNSLDAVRTIVREEGAMALYKGCGPAFLLTSHGGVQFVVYEYLKKHFHFQRATKMEGTKRRSVWERFELSLGYLTMGATSKLVASLVTYPFQVIKSRLQQRAESVELTAEGDVRAVRRDYNGAVDVIRRLWNSEGIAGFFRGSIPNAIRVAPGAAVTFVVYESMMDWLTGN